ncbi:MAG: hypothetical protein K6T88_08550 [Bacillus sp. (in: Bacteria)]|nr:hypothetical protein [Bacillus sp. (in: firmicutes)]
MLNVCCGCGRKFQRISVEVLFCSSTCEKSHDIFLIDKEWNSLTGPIKVSQLSPEELEKYRNQPKIIEVKKPHRVVDWRWPQNRRKNG